MLVQDAERPGEERVKILDFGIAKLSLQAHGTDGKMRTETGTMIGTPAYMAPEQCLADPQLDGKADVYALGIMLYEMLSGRLPYTAEHSFDYMVAHVRGTPRPLGEVAPQVPPEVIDLCHSMIAKSPAERPSMETVVVLLEQLRAAMPAIWAMPAFSASGATPQQGQRELGIGETQLGSTGQLLRQSRQSLAVGATVAGRSTPSERMSKEALVRGIQAGESAASARSARSAQSAQSAQSGRAERASASLSLLVEPPPLTLPGPERLPPITPPAPERRPASRLGLLGGLAAGLLGLGGIVAVVSKPRSVPEVPAAVAVGGAVPAVPRFVHWTVLSVPPGAEVVRADGQLLGTTPLELERPSGNGETILTLRFTGFRDKSMVLGHSTDVKTEVRLESLPAASGPSSTGSTGPAASEPESGSGSAAAKRHKPRVRSSGPKAAGNDVQLLLD